MSTPIRPELSGALRPSRGGREAIADGVDLRGFFAWGALDIVSASSCEMSKRYGFIHVDQDDYGKSTGKCTPKKSFAWMRPVKANNGKEL